MVTVEITVKTEEKGRPSLYQSPRYLFETFERSVKDIIKELPNRKTSNRAIKAVMKKEGKEKLRRFRSFFCKRDFSVREKKVIYDAFFRIFKKYQWAESAGSEREIELKIWITSSIDFLDEVIKTLEEIR